MELLSPVKGIFFDAGWTLFRPVNTDWFINNKMMELIDLSILAAIPQDRKEKVFDRALRYLDDNHYLLTEDDELEQFKVFYSMLAEDLPEISLTEQQISEIAHSKVFDMDNYIHFNDTVPTLKALKGKYKLGVISDTWPSIERILQHGGLENCFDTKTYSCFLGVYKPSEKMYLHALEQMNLPPGQTVFIDDGEENLDGAFKCGIQPVLITVNQSTVNSGKYPSISKLSDILEMLPK